MESTMTDRAFIVHPPFRADKLTIGHNRVLIDQEKFNTYSTSGSTATWVPFSESLMDGGLVRTTKGADNIYTLSLNANGASFTAPALANTLDHVKYLAFKRGPDLLNSKFASADGEATGSYAAPADGKELVFEAEIAARQVLPSGSAFTADIMGRIRDMKSDPRVACGSFVFLDHETGLTLDFLFTDRMIYAIYERLPFARPSAGGTAGTEYAAFTHLIPLASRVTDDDSDNPADAGALLADFTKVAMCYNRVQGYARWLVNGVEKFRISKLGFPLDARYRVIDHGGIAEQIAPRQFSVGVGLFSLMDASAPLNYIGAPTKGLVRLDPTAGFYKSATAVDPATGMKIDGQFVSTTVSNTYMTPQRQGASMNIKNLFVFHQEGGLRESAI